MACSTNVIEHTYYSSGILRMNLAYALVNLAHKQNNLFQIPIFWASYRNWPKVFVLFIIYY
jgi:hypothetical protein